MNDNDNAKTPRATWWPIKWKAWMTNASFFVFGVLAELLVLEALGMVRW